MDVVDGERRHEHCRLSRPRERVHGERDKIPLQLHASYLGRAPLPFYHGCTTSKSHFLAMGGT